MAPEERGRVLAGEEATWPVPLWGRPGMPRVASRGKALPIGPSGAGSIEGGD
jgi:hypothetical protein